MEITNINASSFSASTISTWNYMKYTGMQNISVFMALYAIIGCKGLYENR